LSTIAVVLAALASGCGTAGIGKTYPVRGAVTIDGQPLVAKTTIVLFTPDDSRGNSSPFEPASTVDENGIYTLTTKGRNGAPPGWYKVVVTARSEALVQRPQASGLSRPVTQSLLPARYGQPGTSGLSIEVVENPAPSAYDLNLAQ
jgi:hypothetical protein